MCIFDLPFYYCAIQCNVVFASEIRQLQQLSKSPSHSPTKSIPCLGRVCLAKLAAGPKNALSPPRASQRCSSVKVLQASPCKGVLGRKRQNSG